MANIASVSYRIEGSPESLVRIEAAAIQAFPKQEHWNERETCKILGFTEKELENKRLGGEFTNLPSMEDGILTIDAEESWGLQDFHKLLKQKFPDITVYWIVEEPGCEVYCTNDREGKYFPERYWVDTAQDDIYQSEYFKDEESMFKWLDEKYHVKTYEEVEAWDQNYEATGDDDENFIYIHKFKIVD